MSSPADITIRRLSATAHVGADDHAADVAARVPSLLRRVADGGLAAATASVRCDPGIWCLRRLDVPIRVDPAAGDLSIADAWAKALGTAVEQALRSGSQVGLHYRDEGAGLADLIARVTAGQVDRVWAWHSMGLLDPRDPDVEHAPREAILAVVERRPERALGAVIDAAGQVGVDALHRVLGSSGWQTLARTVARAAGAARPPQLAELVADGPAEAHRNASATRLADRLVAWSRLAALVRAARVRPDASAREAWAVLVAAESDPSSLRRPAVSAITGAMAGMLAGAASGRRPRRPGIPAVAAEVRSAPGSRPRPATPDHREPDSPSAPSADAAAGSDRAGDPPADDARDAVAPSSAGPDPVDATSGVGTSQRTVGRGDDGAGPQRRSSASKRPVGARPAARARLPGLGASGGRDQTLSVTAPAADRAPAAPGQADGGDDALHPTACAGLLFLLATAAGAGVPDDVVRDPALDSRPLPWVLHRVAVDLGVPEDDAASAAFAGVDPARCSVLVQDPPATADEAHRIGALRERWTTVTAVAMGAPGEPSTTVDRIVRRPGVVSFFPGWIELRMSLADVDLDIRRAGLDLDPGWVPWLGTVVRYRYG